MVPPAGGEFDPAMLAMLSQALMGGRMGMFGPEGLGGMFGDEDEDEEDEDEDDA